MNPDWIVRTARALYGEAGWIVNLARAVGTTERHVRHWLHGDELPPADLEERLRRLAAQRLVELQQLVERLNRDPS
jgi:hypothetical protein